MVYIDSTVQPCPIAMPARGEHTRMVFKLPATIAAVQSYDFLLFTLLRTLYNIVAKLVYD